MTAQRPNPFGSLESAHEFMTLLREALDDAYASVEHDTATAQATRGAERRVEALRLVQHKLTRLRQNVQASLVLMNDLRTLRRLLLHEREGGIADSMDER